MWCATLTDGTRSFHPTQQAADDHAGKREHVTWFDSFDYELHNQDVVYRTRIADERARGLAYVAAQLDGLVAAFPWLRMPARAAS